MTALMLAEIDRAMSVGVRFDCVLADAGYGLSAPFRQGRTRLARAKAILDYVLSDARLCAKGNAMALRLPVIPD